MKQTIVTSLTIAALTIGISLSATATKKTVVDLPALGANINATSVSGLSSGAFMTSQLYIAYSDIMVGAGVIAGGPYYCSASWAANTYLQNAEGACMHPLTASSGPNTRFLVDKTKSFAKARLIDKVDNLKDDRIYLFSGSNDQTVTTNVMNQTRQYFLDLDVKNENIHYNKKVDAGHAIITDNKSDVKCSNTEAPYINNCGFEQSHRILNHIYPGLKPAATALEGEIIAFSQKEFIKSNATSMSDTGYLYVPKACSSNTDCKIHVVFHGCEQGATVIGDDYYAKTGYNEVADSNNIIVLYPQVNKSSLSPFNPKGCWDFWGYSSPGSTKPDFYTKDAPQVSAIYRMINRLASNNSVSMNK